MKIIITSLLTIFLSMDLLAQISNPNSVIDFKISTDNSPSTYIQTAPKLFVYGSKRFLTTWKDFRNGEESIYAQWYDSLGNKIKENFRIESDAQIVFSEDEKLMNMYEYGFPTGIDAYIVTLLGVIYNLENQWDNTITFLDNMDITNLELDFFKTGYTVEGYSDGFIYAGTINGITQLYKYGSKGELRKYINLESVLCTIPINKTISVQKDDNYIISYFNGKNYYLSEKDTLPYGIFATFFSKEDSVNAKDILIDKAEDQNEYDWYDSSTYPFIKVINVEDSLYQVFWIYQNSFILNFSKFDSRGSRIGTTHKFYLPHSTLSLSGKRTIDNCTFSNMNEGKSAVFISTEESDYGITKYFISLLYLDKSGYITDSLFNYSQFPELGNQIFYKGNNTFLTINSIYNDIYLTELKNFDILSTNKINDDKNGSNETNPEITVLDNKTNFVTWNYETRGAGQKIDLNGNLIGNQIELKGNQCAFSPNGKCYNLWEKTIRNDSMQIGYTVYNADWNILDDNVLITSDNPYYIGSSITKLSDSLFILYFKNRTTNKVRTLDRNFVAKNELYWTDTDVMEPFGIFKYDDISFWIYAVPYSVQLYSSDLIPISESYNLWVNLYLGNNNFLVCTNNHGYTDFPFFSPDVLLGKILNINGNIIKKDFYLASYVEDYTLTLLPNNNFLVVWQSNNNLYARAFSNEGIPKPDSFLIHSDIQSFKKQPSVAVNGDKVFFVWADARNEGRGYDIYGSIFDLSKVVEVKENKQTDLPTKFVLYQNYPNPFNPITKIRFEIPTSTPPSSSPLLKWRKEAGLVTLKVYDILGNEVATLVNEVKPAGTYEVEFNANDLSSGVYIYQLKAWSFIETKKLILMK